MIAYIITNQKFKDIIKELFIRFRKLNISHVFVTQSYFGVPKEVRLNSTHYLTDYFLKIYRNCTKEPYFFYY